MARVSGLEKEQALWHLRWFYGMMRKMFGKDFTPAKIQMRLPSLVWANVRTRSIECDDGHAAGIQGSIVRVASKHLPCREEHPNANECSLKNFYLLHNSVSFLVLAFRDILSLRTHFWPFTEALQKMRRDITQKASIF
jgi:hypothetical protein